MRATHVRGGGYRVAGRGYIASSTVERKTAAQPHLPRLLLLTRSNSHRLQRYGRLIAAGNDALQVRDWALSSFHRHMRLGNYPVDWAGDHSEDVHEYGERR